MKRRVTLSKVGPSIITFIFQISEEFHRLYGATAYLWLDYCDVHFLIDTRH